MNARENGSPGKKKKTKNTSELEAKMQMKKGSAQNSNYRGMVICPDIFQCSPQTICLKIPNVVVVQRSTDGETRVQPF